MAGLHVSDEEIFVNTFKQKFAGKAKSLSMILKNFRREGDPALILMPLMRRVEDKAKHKFRDLSLEKWIIQVMREAGHISHIEVMSDYDKQFKQSFNKWKSQLEKDIKGMTKKNPWFHTEDLVYMLNEYQNDIDKLFPPKKVEANMKHTLAYLSIVDKENLVLAAEPNTPEEEAQLKKFRDFPLEKKFDILVKAIIKGTIKDEASWKKGIAVLALKPSDLSPLNLFHILTELAVAKFIKTGSNNEHLNQILHFMNFKENDMQKVFKAQFDHRKLKPEELEAWIPYYPKRWIDIQLGTKDVCNRIPSGHMGNYEMCEPYVHANAQADAKFSEAMASLLPRKK